LFGFVRGGALLGCVVVLIAIALVIVALVKPGHATSVTYADILRARADSVASSSASLTQAQQTPVPAEIRKYVYGYRQAILDGWLSNLDLDQKQDFLNGLALVIREAEQKDSSDVIRAVNDYKTLKLAKLSTGTFDRYAQQARRPSLFAAIVGLLGVLGLLAMILVLLAIERNTRLRTIDQSS
jgi:hypothetical protein